MVYYTNAYVIVASYLLTISTVCYYFIPHGRLYCLQTKLSDVVTMWLVLLLYK